MHVYVHGFVEGREGGGDFKVALGRAAAKGRWMKGLVERWFFVSPCF
jgi:hypothetical protein